MVGEIHGIWFSNLYHCIKAEINSDYRFDFYDSLSSLQYTRMDVVLFIMLSKLNDSLIVYCTSVVNELEFIQ